MCPYVLPSLEQQLQVPDSVQKPISLSASDELEKKPTCKSGFTIGTQATLHPRTGLGSVLPGSFDRFNSIVL